MATTKPPRSYWPIAIMTYFAIAILGIVTFITWAVRQDMDLVRKDYYAQDVSYQQQFDRVQRAQQLNSAAKIDYDDAAQIISITLPAAQLHQATMGFIHFYRPSDASLDQTVKLEVNETGAQQINAKSFAAGHWKIRVYWKVSEEEFYFERSVILGGKS